MSIARTLPAVLFVIALVLLSATVEATFDHDVPFVQYNASKRCVYGNASQTNLSDWGVLPFSSPVIDVQRLGEDVSGSAVLFLLLTANHEVYVASISSHGESSSNRDTSVSFCQQNFHKMELPFPKQSTTKVSCRLAQQPAGHCFFQSSAGQNCRSGVLMACSSGCVGLISLPHQERIIKNPNKNSFLFPSFIYSCAATNLFPLTASSSFVPTIWSISLQVQSKLASVYRHPSLLMVATSRGLFAWWMAKSNNASLKSVQVALTNTTGSREAVHNVTHVGCLPPSAFPLTGGEPSLFGFMGGNCFATSRNHVCTSNICPADLVHLINSSSEMRFVRVPGVIDGAPTATAYDERRDAVVFANEVCLNFLFRNGTLLRVEGIRRQSPTLGGVGGLPQHFLTSAAYNPKDGTLWFGSKLGLVMLRQDWTWKYFYGPRWLPGQSFDAGMNVIAFDTFESASTPVGGSLVATDGGLAWIQKLNWTLEQKATQYQNWVPFFDRYGTFDQHEFLSKWGDPHSFSKGHSSNEGVWTSMTLAGQIFRYATLKAGNSSQNEYELKDAKRLCWRGFSGLELLVNVTGVRGLMARAAVQTSTPPSQGGPWIQSKAMPGWMFWAQASSDEVTGHLHVYPLMYDLVATTSQEKERVLRLVRDITSYIVDNGLKLIDVDGKPTQWGHWEPSLLNDSPFWYDERGLGSLQILSYLCSAYRLTGNETYAKVFRNLVEKHQYGLNVINFKITQPSDIDHSDDLLSFFSLLLFKWSETNRSLFSSSASSNWANPLTQMIKPYVDAAIMRWWQFIEPEKPSLYSPLVLWYLQDCESKCMMAQRHAQAALLWCLQTWPISLVRWPTNNTARLDITISPYDNRVNNPNLILNPPMLPYDESSPLIWNTDMFRTIQGTPYSIDNPGGQWLYPYWMARYFGFL